MQLFIEDLEPRIGELVRSAVEDMWNEKYDEPFNDRWEVTTIHVFRTGITKVELTLADGSNSDPRSLRGTLATVSDQLPSAQS